MDAHRRIAHTPTGRQVGIDLGLHVFYADSEGAVIHTPRFLRKGERRITRLQRRVSRKSDVRKSNVPTAESSSA